MSLFLRLLGEDDKGAALADAVRSVAAGTSDPRAFEVAPESFEQVPGAPFAYWVSEGVRELFPRLPEFEQEGRTARRGPSTCDDYRYLRCWWEEIDLQHGVGHWRSFAKGGTHASFYTDIHLLVDWEPRRETFLGFFGRPGREIERPESVDHFFRPGLTWPRRTTSGLALRVMPAGCIFADKGPAAFVAGDDPEALLALLAVTNSAAFRTLVALQLAAADAAARSYEVGVIQRTPIPALSGDQARHLAGLARRAWSLKRSLDTAEPTSHAFVLPVLLQAEGPILAERAGAWARRVEETEAELARIQAEIDERCFELYGFAPEDRAAALAAAGGGAAGENDAEDEGEEGE